jgi:DivIVA domain-containing protein
MICGVVADSVHDCRPGLGCMMRCLGCGAEIAERAQVCARCGWRAPAEYLLYVAEDRAAEAACDTPGGPEPSAMGASVGQQSPDSAPDPDVDGAVLAEWVETGRFSGTRRRPGYDEGEVDAFLDEAESRLPAQVARPGEQPQDELAGQPQIGELELDADSLPIQNGPATSRAYLTATACLVGSLVSVGLAAAEIAEYARHNRVDNLAILGGVIGGLAGIMALVNDNDKRRGWAHRINTVAVLLGFIGLFGLLFLYGGIHGWDGGG